MVLGIMDTCLQALEVDRKGLKEQQLTREETFNVKSYNAWVSIVQTSDNICTHLFVLWK